MTLLATPVPDVEAAFSTVTDALRMRPVAEALHWCQGFQQRLDVLETELLATRARHGASDADLDKDAGRGKIRSKSEASKRTKRAKTTNENPKLGEDLNEGTLTPQQLDAITVASEGSNGAAAHDQLLIDRIRAANPDQATAIARAWLDDYNRDKVEERYERQRQLRKVSRFTTLRGTEAIMAEGDTPTIDNIWKRIEAESKKLYEHDGGRDLKADKHPRTPDQRRFDAFETLAQGANTDQASSSGRPTVVLCDRDGANAEIPGTGPLPKSVLERLLCEADLAGAVFAENGQPLWLGRSTRTTSRTQWVALVARDKGCVLCGADPTHCEAHHIIPWHAPAKGRSDIDNLVLLCSSCHHHTHDSRQTIERAPETGNWQLRPATPDETPPPRTKDPP